MTDTAAIPTHLAEEVLAGGAPPEVRDQRLEGGAASLAAGGRKSLLLDSRALIAVAGALMTSGVAAIVLGWLGASRSILVSEQVPYLISGGLLGLALATIGALAYFTHWLTVLVRDNRAQHAELVRLLRDERDREHRELVQLLTQVPPPVHVLPAASHEVDAAAAPATAAKAPARRRLAKET